MLTTLNDPGIRARDYTTRERALLEELKALYTKEKAIPEGIDTASFSFVVANFLGAVVGLVPDEEFPGPIITALVNKNIAEGNETILKYFINRTLTTNNLSGIQVDERPKLWH